MAFSVNAQQPHKRTYHYDGYYNNFQQRWIPGYTFNYDNEWSFLTNYRSPNFAFRPGYIPSYGHGYANYNWNIYNYGGVNTYQWFNK